MESTQQANLMKKEMAQSDRIKKLETQYEKENRNLNEQLNNMQ